MTYFAYGSNLHQMHLREWLESCGLHPGSLSDPRRAVLEGYRLRTNYLRAGGTAAANIEVDSRGRVEGIVYRITPEGWWGLRLKEGFPRRYEEVVVWVRLVGSNRLIPALTYLVTPRHRMSWDAPVTPEYRRLILEGAERQRLTLAYRSRLARLLHTVPDISGIVHQKKVHF